ncbi:MAG: 2-polyprenylphenol 6-hydroxylase [Rickettsiales bacterium]|nr:2-polyprenylphenol 6-hydroxylase [Rickettsiales bacterium]
MKNIISLIYYLATLVYYDALFFCKKLPVINILILPLRIFTVLHLGKSRGERLCIAFNRMGPTFIKLGQLLSCRSDLVGAKMANDLSALQDSLPAAKFSKINKQIEQDLQGTIGNKFLEFNPIAISVASISEVFKATTHDQQLVAVKVLRPKIKQRFKRDISLLFFFAHLANIFPRLKRLRPVDVIKTFQATSMRELDLRFEAASNSELSDNLKSNPNIQIPKIHWELTSENILVSEWIEGTKISHKNELKARDHNITKIAEDLLLCYFDMAYRDGLFHADLHPGNILITHSGKIVLIDFGIVGRLSKDDRIYVTKILDGFIRKDYAHVAKIHLDAGYIPRSTNVADFALACRSIGEPLFNKPLDQISIARLLELLFRITENYGMETQPQLLLLQKTLLTVEGVVSHLDSNVNIWELGRPWMENWGKENMGPKAHIKDLADKSSQMLHKLPSIIDDLADMLEQSKSNKSQLAKKMSLYKALLAALIIGAIIGKIFL